MGNRDFWAWMGKIGVVAAGIAGTLLLYRFVRGFAAGWTMSTDVHDPLPGTTIDVGFDR